MTLTLSKSQLVGLAVIVLGLAVALAPEKWLPEWLPVVGPAKVTAVTYVYEKGDTAIPSPVEWALNKLNREHGIIATKLEIDSTDGDLQIPDQYKVTVPAAKDAGLPCLVAEGESKDGRKVIRVVKKPTTDTEVLEAAK